MWQQNGFRIPTILAIALVGGTITVASLLSDNARLLLGRAAHPPEVIPQTVTITNITDTSALVYWKSEQPVAHTIRHESSSGETTLYDIRDTDNTAKQYKLHVFALQNLSPSSSISFDIYLGNQPVYKGTITTGPDLGRPPQALPLYGSAPENVSDNAEGVLITATIDNSATWTTFHSSTSNWVIPLASIRTTDLSSFYCSANTCSGDTPVRYEFSTSSSTETKNSTLEQSRPFSPEPDAVEDESTSRLPLTLAEDTPASVTASPAATLRAANRQPASPTPTTRVLSASTQSEDVTIQSPKEDALLSFPKPLIRGTGAKNKEVLITVSGNITQVGRAVVDEKGRWQWTPVYPFSAGRYELSIATLNSTGRRITLQRSFTILKSGERVLYASTPSATLVPSPTEILPTATPFTAPPSATPTLYVTAGPAVGMFFVGGGAMLLLLALSLL